MFKYFSFAGKYRQYSKQLLTDCQIYFSSPIDFNDPFDCSATFSSKGTSEEWRKNFLKHLRRTEPKTPPAERLKKARRFVTQGRHKENRKHLGREVAANWGVYCLSAIPDDILMWSRYVDKHRGYVVEFDSQHPRLPFCAALEVSYSPEYKQASIFQSERELLQTIMFSKAEQWRYEAEFRLMSRPDEPRLQFIDASSLVGIYFGCRTSEIDKLQIRELISSGHCKPKFYQYEKNETDYKLDLCELD